MERMNKPEPQKQHHWLARLVGEWSLEGEMMMKPGQPGEPFRGTERVRSMDGIWFIAEGIGEMPGGDMSTSLMTLGYDPRKERFVGTFIGSMAHMWIYEGSLDAAENVLTLDTEGPGMSGDGTLS